MTSLSDGLGPQNDPNSGRTRVESGPAGTHRPTTRRGSGIAQPSVPRARCPECLARRGCGPARAIVTPDAPPAIAARGDRGPWVSLPLRATIPEGNTGGQQRRRRPIASRAGAEGAGADRGHRRIDAGDIDAGETWETRSEEHTSELQSQSNLVCRLL